MLRFLSDENFNGHVLQALMSSEPALDVARAQDVGLGGAQDPDVLEWAAVAGRVLLTRDRKTMVGFAYDRVSAGQPMPGVVVTRDDLPIPLQVQDILIVAICNAADGMDDQVIFLPI
jgi:predicted nuclease of predicted toxin-antitoxin system